MPPTLHLKPGHVQPVWAGHPWIYAQAVARVEGGAVAGEELQVLDPRGNFLGRGFYSPKSAIVTRIVSRARAEQEPFDAQFFRKRLALAERQRRELGLGGPQAEGDSRHSSGYRLVHAEGDHLPGLIIDRLGDVCVIQFLTLGMKRRETEIVSALWDLLQPKAVVDRTPERAAKAEGFPSAFEKAAGTSTTKLEGAGENRILRGGPVDALEFTERGLRYRIPFSLSQKTGFYFDQRDVRKRVEELSRGKKVLDAYGYVGSFAMSAARGGAAEVLSVDESVLAAEIGSECARLNGFSEVIRFQRADARKVLAESGSMYDLAVVDPPRLAPTRSARENALVHYAKLANLGCRAVRPGGLLVFCSCSSAIDMYALTRALAMGAQRANVEATILERHFQAPDHPVPAAFGEGLYLKALIARIDPRSAFSDQAANAGADGS